MNHLLVTTMVALEYITRGKDSFLETSPSECGLKNSTGVHWAANSDIDFEGERYRLLVLDGDLTSDFVAEETFEDFSLVLILGKTPMLVYRKDNYYEVDLRGIARITNDQKENTGELSYYFK